METPGTESNIEVGVMTQPLHEGVESNTSTTNIVSNTTTPRNDSRQKYCRRETVNDRNRYHGILSEAAVAA